MRLIVRVAALLAGAFSVLVALVTRTTLSAGLQFAHASAMLGGGIAIMVGSVVAARRPQGMPLREFFAATWLGAAGAAVLTAAVRSPTPRAVGTGLGVGIVAGLVLSVGLAGLVYGIHPRWLVGARSADAVATTP
jgi:hypothetical protein